MSCAPGVSESNSAINHCVNVCDDIRSYPLPSTPTLGHYPAIRGFNAEKNPNQIAKVPLKQIFHAHMFPFASFGLIRSSWFPRLLIYRLFLPFQPSQSNEALFEPDYYWGHTVFRSKPWSSLYLGTDANGMATLVTMEDSQYPNPQALFIVNKYNVIGVDSNN